MKKYEVTFSNMPFPKTVIAETLWFDEKTGQKVLCNNHNNCNYEVVAVVPAEGFVYETPSQPKQPDNKIRPFPGLDSDK